MSSDAAFYEGDRDRDKGGDAERGEKNERGGSKQKSAGTKTKDLSHVPCKFFKVGGCTAGSSCPFSHVVQEPGHQKETCTWFVKGNCKFGHKCALAHVLPGQSMAMDRKNKKAAQAVANASGLEKTKSGGKSGKKDAAGSAAGNKLSLLAGGSTAPTRILNSPSSDSKSPRLPISMSLKATISPSAPAPALNDTDFATFSALDEFESLQQRASALQNVDDSPTTENSDSSTESTKPAPKADSSAEPISLLSFAPPPSRPPATSTFNDFGPIGSPPNYRIGRPISPTHANGATFSPATSPRNRVNPGSSPSRNVPLSAPGTQEHFVSSSFSMRGGGGIAASLGSGLAMMGGRRGFDDSNDVGPNSFSGLLGTQLSSSVSQGSALNGLGMHGEYDINIEYDEFSGVRRRGVKGIETAVEDDDLEGFLPSSLNDLLTPQERSRRMSRSNSGQKPAGVSQLTSALASANLGADQGTPLGQNEASGTGNGNGHLGHRYSRSVPAPTLLGDIKSIWTDPTVNPMPSSPHRGGIPPGTISSALGGANALVDEMALSMSFGSGAGGTPSSVGMLSPSNASAAFLPGLHRHYLDAKAKQAQQSQIGHSGIRGGGGGIRGPGNPIFANASTTSNSSLAGSYLQPLGGVGLPSSVSNPSNLHMHVHGNTTTAYRTTPSPFDLTQTLHQPQPQPHTTGTISNLTSQTASKLDDPLLALSPGSRALQNHAPGQSLPQGLAAGYSRIHALPPLTNITSPSSNVSFIPGSSPSGILVGGNHNHNNNEGLLGEWPVSAQHQQQHQHQHQHQQQQQQQQQGGISSGSFQSNAVLDSMFSRLSYAATTRSSNTATSAHTGAPPGLSRGANGGRYHQGPLSPLGGPMVTRDDDIMFDMDK